MKAGVCLWLDVHDADGTKQWAVRSDFSAGTHDWEHARDLWIPAKPVERIEFFASLRTGSGTAEFTRDPVALRAPRANT